MKRWHAISLVAVFALLISTLSGRADRPERIPFSEGTIDRPANAGSAARIAPGAAPSVIGSFSVNDGQWDPRVRFGLQDRNVSAFFTKDGLTLAASQGHAIKAKFVGGASVDPVGIGEGRAKSRYLGRGLHPSTVGEVRYRNVWKGIDVFYEARKDGIEYSLDVDGGADLSDIRLTYEGAEVAGTDSAGNLRLTTDVGEFIETKPRAFQDGREIECAFQMNGDGTYGFTLGDFDPARPLLIDPTLLYATYLNGTGAENEAPGDVELDAAGNLIVVGAAMAGFPTTGGSFDPTHNGNTDGFVMKFDGNGTLVWSAYVGGTDVDVAIGVSADSQGNVYVFGTTSSPDLPATTGALSGTNDIFMARISADGTSLDWLTYLGGTGIEFAFGNTFEADAAGNVYFAALTTSTDLPTTPGAWGATINGFFDMAVGRLDAGGTIGWLTYFGGTATDFANGLTVDASGNVYITGQTDSGTTNDFPTTIGAYDETWNNTIVNGSDAFVTKINSGGGLGWSTFLGGVFSDYGYAIALDPVTGDVIVTGDPSFSSATPQSYPTFPWTAGTYDTNNAADTKAFVARFSPDGSNLIWSTFVGGTAGNTVGRGVQVGPNGDIFVTGLTSSASHPVTGDAYQATHGGGNDAWVSVLDANGQNLLWSTYFGGTLNEIPFAIDVDPFGTIAITGSTTSTDLPTTPGALDTVFDGGNDVFVALFGTVRIVRVDSTAPDGMYGAGQSMDVQVFFSSPVFVTGTPTLTLETGASDAVITYTGGTGTNTLTFNYTVVGGHGTPDLDYVSPNALSANGGTIQDLDGNDANLLLPFPGQPGSLGANRNIIIETTPPAAGSVRDGLGADIDSQLDRFSLSANWDAFTDPESGVVDYEWAIGSTQGGTQIQPFTSIGLLTSATNNTLNLVDGNLYYISVRATNGVGMQTVQNSDGVSIGSLGSNGRKKSSSCSAASGRVASWPAALLGLLVLLALLRSRRVLCVLAIVAAMAARATAQVGPQEDPLFEQDPKPRRYGLQEYWEYLGTAPYATNRTNVWTSLIHIPSMTDASEYPAGAWKAGIGTELTYEDFEDNSQAGTSKWKALHIRETVDLGYGVTDAIQIGGRLVFGELFQDDNERITLYDGNAQIIPDGSRGFGVESLVLHGKIVGDLGFARWGLKGDLKIPLASEDNLLTAQTFDIGATGILTADMGILQLTANVGVVYPLGDADIFLDDDLNDLDPVIHAGVSVSYPIFETLVGVFQVEANNSPFGELAVLDEVVVGAYLSVRYRMMKYHTRQRQLYRSEEGFLGFLVGTGFGELGNDLTVGLNVDFSF